jgi:hypothetical protein
VTLSLLSELTDGHCGPTWGMRGLWFGRPLCFRTAHGYLGIGHPGDEAVVSDLLEALSLFGDDALVAWDRDVAGWLPHHVDTRDIGGAIWVGGSRIVGTLWFGNCRTVFHLHRERMSDELHRLWWHDGHGC